MNRDLNRIRAMCQQYPIQAKLLIIPSMTMQSSILKTLNDEGLAPINLEMTTVGNLAVDIARVSIAKERLKLLNLNDSTEMIRMAFEKLSQEKKLNYFSEVRASKGLYKALASTIMEIKQAGWKQNLVDLNLIENPNKAKDIVELMTLYHEFLEKSAFIDQADLTERALALVEKSKSYQAIHLLEGCHLSYLEEQLIEKLGFKKEETHDLHLTDCKKAVSSIPKILLKKTYGSHLEVKEVFRTIYRKKLPFDQVLIVGMSKAPYSDLIYKLLSQYTQNNDEIAKEKQMPITFESGLPASLTSPFKLALALLEWIESGYTVQGLTRLLSDGAMSLDQLKTEDENLKITRPLLVQVLLNSNITWQRATYAHNLEALSQRSSHYGQVALILSQFIEREIFKVIPEESQEGTVVLDVFLEGIRTFLSRNALIQSKRDQQALTRINEELVTAIQEMKLPLDEVIANVKNQLFALQVEEESPSEGKIHFTTVNGAQWIPRKYIFLIGNDANTFLKNRNEDPVLLDKERSHTLKKSTEKYLDDLKAINRFLLSVKNPLEASYSYFDTQQNREVFPSLIFKAMEEKMGGESSVETVDMVLDNLGDSFDSEDYVIKQSVKNHALHPRVEEKETPLQTPEENQAPPPYHENFDPRKNGISLSASMLQTYLECEYRYFLKYILKLKEIPSQELDKLGWLSHLEIGKLYHSIFESFMKESLRDQSLLASQEKALESIEKIAAEIIQAYEKSLPVASEYHTIKEKEEIFKNCRRFALKEVEEKKDYLPLEFEFEFGSKEKLQVQLPDGSSVSINGFIDRMDQIVKDKSIRIIDYKTGSTFGYEALKNMDKNLINAKSIQPLLYFLALDALGIKPVSSALYVFVTSKGGYESLEISFESLRPEQIKKELQKLLDRLSTGLFQFTDDAFKCKYCPYVDVCRQQEVKSQ